MSRQISVKRLKTKRANHSTIGSSGAKKIPCPRCKKKFTRAKAPAAIIKDVKLKMERKGMIAQTSPQSGIVEDSILILSTMGIGVVTHIPADPNPRSENDQLSELDAAFSLLKIETDTTKIPNSKIVDRRSKILKRGDTKFVRADSIRPFSRTDAFFKPDAPNTAREAEQIQRIKKVKQHRNLSGLVDVLIKQQMRIPIKFMDTNFKHAIGLGQ